MASPAKSLSTVRLFGLGLSPLNYEETLAWLAAQMKSNGRRHCVFTANVDQVVRYARDPELRQAYETADLVVADGMPLVWSADWLGERLQERVAGIDLLHGLCALSAAEEYRCYLLGARPEVNAEARGNLIASYPPLRICGTHSGYFEQDRPVVEAINQAKTQVLFVGMGSPRQELWLGRNWAALNCRIALTVGGAFDVIAGKLIRAPLNVQKLGLEWMWRMLQEPRRLGRRYLIEGGKFLPLLWREWQARRRASI
ncbi:MAG TPA: WecB/TagA/CpsF family glycosyltransferase [Terriglobales bacterium]|nr:WecB/TagA/CpsF family glycosyltransferase [Terriglobales bacterium]